MMLQIVSSLSFEACKKNWTSPHKDVLNLWPNNHMYLSDPEMIH